MRPTRRNHWGCIDLTGSGYIGESNKSPKRQKKIKSAKSFLLGIILRRLRKQLKSNNPAVIRRVLYF